ncbi:MAG: hypothetical protein Q4D96_14250 [Propionibacteriaceae bacterium]|nr:hypothetical protein [Propionibacteriaceae bacterium]
MPTKFADTFAVGPVEGWEVGMHYQKEGAFCWVGDIVDNNPFPGPALKVQHIHNWFAEGDFAGRRSRVPALTYEEVIGHQKSVHWRNEYKKWALLPDRVIGGERAPGLTYRYEGEKHHAVIAEFYIIRHDGLWTFTLHSGINRDVIDPDTYRVLDTFRWTGPFDEASLPPSAEPSPEPSPSESEE